MKDLVVKHWRWKLISLALAVMLWLSTAGEPESGTSLSVPVFYQNSPREWEISSSVIDRVRLEVHGPASKLSQHAMADAAVMVDLSVVKRPGEITIPLDGAAISLPAGVHVDRVMPPQVRLRFEKRLVKEIPVQARVSAQPPAGYEVVMLRVTPALMQVEGPESSVEAMTAAETDDLDLSGVTGKESIASHASLDDPMVRFVKGSRVVVEVEVRKAGGGQ